MVRPKDQDFQKSSPPIASPTYGQPPLQPPPQNYSHQPEPPQNYSHQPEPPQNYSHQPAPPQNHSHQPVTGIPVQHGELTGQQPTGQWSTGLCDCFDDVPNCCMTYWCPCVTFGRIAEIVDRGSTSCGASGSSYVLITCLIGCPCIYSCLYRVKMRKLYQLPGNTCTDCLIHFFCESCALCQEYRELQNRGFDMSLGWHGNVERQNQGVTMPPFVQGGMNR